MPVCLVSETERKHVMEVFKFCRPGSPDVRLWTISGEKCMLTGTVWPKRGKCFTRHAEWNWRWVPEGASEQAMNPGPTTDGAPASRDGQAVAVLQWVRKMWCEQADDGNYFQGLSHFNGRKSIPKCPDVHKREQKFLRRCGLVVERPQLIWGHQQWLPRPC